MAGVFGKRYTKEELLKKSGSIAQLCGIKLSELQGGRSTGVRLAHFWTGSGLEFDVNVSRGIGLGAFRYRGIPFGWISPAGDVAPWYYEPQGDGLDRSYTGGLMHNAGLRQVGAPCEDDGEQLGLHGRISNLPADEVHIDSHWEDDEYIMSLYGTVTEARALGEHLVLKRKITTQLGSREVLLEDRIENEGLTASPFQYLYHTNFGFPLIDQGTRLVIPSQSVTDAADGRHVPESEYSVCKGAGSNQPDSIYFHHTAEKNGKSGYAVVNESLKLGLQVMYSKKNLPELIHWSCMEYGRNVMEVGPSNCKCFGRKAERIAGSLQYLEPGEIRNFQISFKVLDGRDEIRYAETLIHNIKSETERKSNG